MTIQWINNVHLLMDLLFAVLIWMGIWESFALLISNLTRIKKLILYLVSTLFGIAMMLLFGSLSPKRPKMPRSADSLLTQKFCHTYAGSSIYPVL